MSEFDQQVVELQRLAELKRVFAAFAHSQIPTVVYKGTALAYRYYLHPYVRERCDTDLMIPIEKLDEVKRVLKDLGYAFLPNSDEGSYQVAAVLEKDGFNHVLDVHWKFSNRALFSELFDYASMKKHSENLEALGVDIPDIVNSLIIACLHPVMHHHGELHDDWIEDLGLIASQFTTDDWRELKRRCRELAISAVVAKVLNTARLVPIDWVDLDDSAPERQRLEFQKNAKSRMSVAWFDFRYQPSIWARIRFLKNHLFPPRSYMAATGRSYFSRFFSGLLKLLKNRA